MKATRADSLGGEAEGRTQNGYVKFLQEVGWMRIPLHQVAIKSKSIIWGIALSRGGSNKDSDVALIKRNLRKIRRYIGS